MSDVNENRVETPEVPEDSFEYIFADPETPEAAAADVSRPPEAVVLDAQTEFNNMLNQLQANPVGRQFLQGVQQTLASQQQPQSQAPVQQPIAPDLDAEIQAIESEIKGYAEKQQNVPDEVARRYYMKLGAKGAVEALGPQLQRTQGYALLDQRVQEAKNILRQQNPYFSRYEKTFEQEFRSRLGTMPEMLTDPSRLGQVMEYIDGLSMKRYVTEQGRKSTTPPPEPSTGRFVPPTKGGKNTYVVPDNIYGIGADNLATYGDPNQSKWQMDITAWEKGTK